MRRAVGLVVACFVMASAALASGGRPIVSHGVRVVVPAGWHRLPAAMIDEPVVDPVTVLVVGTHGVRPRTVACQIAAYRIPPAGAAVVVVRWRTETSGGGHPPRSRAPLRHVHLDRGGFECWPGHRGAAVELSLGGHAYQVSVLIGDRASSRTVAQALGIVASFDLRRR
jgi:hypothetical protein